MEANNCPPLGDPRKTSSDRTEIGSTETVHATENTTSITETEIGSLVDDLCRIRPALSVVGEDSPPTFLHLFDKRSIASDIDTPTLYECLETEKGSLQTYLEIAQKSLASTQVKEFVDLVNNLLAMNDCNSWLFSKDYAAIVTMEDSQFLYMVCRRNVPKQWHLVFKRRMLMSYLLQDLCSHYIRGYLQGIFFYNVDVTFVVCFYVLKAEMTVVKRHMDALEAYKDYADKSAKRIKSSGEYNDPVKVQSFPLVLGSSFFNSEYCHDLPDSYYATNTEDKEAFKLRHSVPLTVEFNKLLHNYLESFKLQDDYFVTRFGASHLDDEDWLERDYDTYQVFERLTRTCCEKLAAFIFEYLRTPDPSLTLDYTVPGKVVPIMPYADEGRSKFKKFQTSPMKAILSEEFTDEGSGSRLLVPMRHMTDKQMAFAGKEALRCFHSLSCENYLDEIRPDVIETALGDVYIPGEPEELDNRRYDGQVRRARKALKKSKALSYRLYGMGVVFEFGKRLDFWDEAHAQMYLTEYDLWLKDLHYPADYDALNDFVRKHFAKRKHRYIACSLLAPTNPTAAMFCAMFKGLQKNKFLAKYGPHKQGVYWDLMSLGFLFAKDAILTLTADAVTGVKDTIPKLEAVKSFAAPVISFVQSVQEMCAQIWSWVKETYNSILSFISRNSEIVYDFLKAIAIGIAMRLGLELAKTIWPDQADTLHSAVESVALDEELINRKSVPEKQGGPAFMHPLFELLSYIGSLTYELPLRKLVWFMGFLPKIKSCGEAIKWILQNIQTLFALCCEVWTGEPQPRCAFERDIFQLDRQVWKIKSKFDKGRVDDLIQEKTMNKLKAMDAEILRLERVMMNLKEVRAPVTAVWNQARSEFKKLLQRSQAMKTSGRPRPASVWVYIYGDPGLGKSECVREFVNLVYNYCRTYGPQAGYRDMDPFSDAQIFQLNQAEEYWDKYAAQFCVFCDDVFQNKDVEMRTRIAEDFIRFISTHAESLRVADMNLKGCQFFESPLLVTTSNVVDFRTAHFALESWRALDSRKTITARKLKDGFQISDSIDGQQDKLLSLDELAALAGECILTRFQSLKTDITERVPARFTGTFAGGRMTIGNVPPALPTPSLPSVSRRDKGKDKQRVWKQKQGLEEILEDPTVDIPTTSRRLSLETRADLNFCGRIAAATAGLVPQTHYLDQFDRLFPRGEFRTRADSWDESIWTRLFKGPSFQKRLTSRPGYYLPRLSESAYAILRHAWGCYADTLEKPNDDQARIWMARFLLKYGWQVSSPLYTGIIAPTENLENMWLDMTTRYTWFKTGVIVVPVVAVSLVAAGSLIMACMPASAHQKKKQGYDHNPKGQRISKKIVRRPQHVPNSRIQKVIGSSSQGNHSSIYAQVAENYEWLETRISSKDLSLEEAIKLTPSNSSWCLCVGGHLYLVPLHVIFDLGEVTDNRWVSLMQHNETIFSLKDIVLVKEFPGDLGLVLFPDTIQERKHIAKHFSDGLSPHARLNHLRPIKGYTGLEVIQARSWYSELELVNPNDRYPDIYSDLGIIGIPNEAGMCGTVYFDSYENKIVGVHIGGSPVLERAYATTIKRGDIEPFLKGGYKEHGDAGLFPVKQSQTMPGNVALGVVDGRNVCYIPDKTNIEESTFDVDTFPIPKTTDAPAMLKPHGDIRPLSLALKKFSKCVTYGPGHRRVSDDGFFHETFDWNVASRMMTLEEALFGVPGRIKSIDFDASLGFFFKRMGFKSRRDLCRPEDRYIHPILRRCVEQWFEDVDRGILPAAVYEETLKDEIRDAERVAQGKTRLFANGDFRTAIVTKMILGWFIHEAERDPVCSPVAATINVHSDHWGRIYSALRGRPEENRKLFQGDFSYFDFSESAKFKGEFSDMIASRHEKPAYVRAIIDAVLVFAYHIVRAWLFLRLKGNSSGCIITTIFNCYVNWKMHKEAFLDLFSEEEFIHLVLRVLGDDSIGSVPEKYGAYNMLYLQEWFRKWYQMEYTAPDKTCPKHSDWEDAVFLKRRFVRGELGMMAPLDLSSIANSVRWTEHRGDLKVMQSVLTSVQLEVFHHGPELYNQCLDWMKAEEKRLGTYFHLLTYEEMRSKRFKDYHP